MSCDSFAGQEQGAREYRGPVPCWPRAALICVHCVRWRAKIKLAAGSHRQSVEPVMEEAQNVLPPHHSTPRTGVRTRPEFQGQGRCRRLYSVAGPGTCVGLRPLPTAGWDASRTSREYEPTAAIRIAIARCGHESRVPGPSLRPIDDAPLDLTTPTAAREALKQHPLAVTVWPVWL